MGNVFFISEILEFAIEKENESYTLYKNLGERLETEKAKKLCETLMEQELKHKEIYLDFLKKIETEEKALVRENHQYNLYMQEQIKKSRKKSVFKVEKTTTIQEIIDYGIEREKESILFYAGLKYYVSEADKKFVDEIITEESSHIVMLLELEEALV
jgi:rubrerythrin